VKQHAPAAERNAAPILDVLARALPDAGLVLEIASGSGQHAIYMARALPRIEWQPSDPSSEALASIAAWRDEAALPNLRAPLALDVRAPWPIDRADAVVCINMLHISPWTAAEALFAGAARVLPPAGVLYTYGPYRIDGVTAPSNEAFDRSLRARDDAWGVREVRELERIARGFALTEMVAMPANNHSLVWTRSTSER
jgi:SAM-dependent methyltransferase